MGKDPEIRMMKSQFKVIAEAVVVTMLVSGQGLAAESGTNVQAKAKAAEAATVRKVQVEEFEKLWQDKQNVVLDVRTKKEFDAGHIPGATNLDVNGPDFEKSLASLDRSKLYLVHCAAGVRSARACQTMSRAGFTNLVDLAPGFKGWEQAGKQIEK
jgi:phage shock protein E